MASHPNTPNFICEAEKGCFIYKHHKLCYGHNYCWTFLFNDKPYWPTITKDKFVIGKAEDNDRATEVSVVALVRSTSYKAPTHKHPQSDYRLQKLSDLSHELAKSASKKEVVI